MKIRLLQWCATKRLQICFFFYNTGQVNSGLIFCVYFGRQKQPGLELRTFFNDSSVSLSWLPTCTFTSRGQCAARADRDASPSCLQRYAVYFCRLGQCEASEDTPSSWTPLQSEMLISVTFCLLDAIFTRRSSFTCSRSTRGWCQRG